MQPWHGVALSISVMLAMVGCRPAQPGPSSQPAPEAIIGEFGNSGSPEVEHFRVEVLAEYPHDRTAFTQGLVVREGALYESTGLREQSTLRNVDRETGAVQRSVSLDRNHFAEGLAS